LFIKKYFLRHNSSNNREGPLQIPNQRFQPLLAPNETAKNTSSLFQEPLAKLSNITNDIKDKVFNKLGIGNNSLFNRNVALQQEQQPDQGEHARVPPELGAAGDKESKFRVERNNPNRLESERMLKRTSLRAFLDCNLLR
jgi:hypothetical protein